MPNIKGTNSVIITTWSIVSVAVVSIPFRKYSPECGTNYATSHSKSSTPRTFDRYGISMYCNTVLLILYKFIVVFNSIKTFSYSKPQ